MNIIKALKRLYYRFRNKDPIWNCEVYKEEGCSFVDGILCDYPNCKLLHERLGHKFVYCVECVHQDECCSTQFGLGCYDGEKIRSEVYEEI